MTVTALDLGTTFDGIGTDAYTIHVAIIDPWGRDLDDKEFPITPAGYRDTLSFLTSAGAVAGIGIEGTSSYGVGIAHAAVDAGLEVFEVIRPERGVRREGKSNPLDAYQAARAVLSGRASAAAKAADIAALRRCTTPAVPRSRRGPAQRSRSRSS